MDVQPDAATVRKPARPDRRAYDEAFASNAFRSAYHARFFFFFFFSQMCLPAEFPNRFLVPSYCVQHSSGALAHSRKHGRCTTTWVLRAIKLCFVHCSVLFYFACHISIPFCSP
jgi:hypothetical protein